MRTVTLKQARWAVVLTFAALWPAWIRQVKFGLVSFPVGLALFVGLLVWWTWEQRSFESDQSTSSLPLAVAMLLLLVYTFSYGVIPPLSSQLLATVIFACAVLATYPRNVQPHRVAMLVLFPLTLPVEMALQFVLGYPFRRVSAEIVGVLLSPYGVTIKGTTLMYVGHALEVDAACSGVLGWWAFVIIGALLSLLLGHRWMRLMLTLGAATVAAIAYNVLRTSLLFMYRFHEGAETPAMHSTLGVIAFIVAVSAFTLTVMRWLTPRHRLQGAG